MVVVMMIPFVVAADEITVQPVPGDVQATDQDSLAADVEPRVHEAHAQKPTGLNPDDFGDEEHERLAEVHVMPVPCGQVMGQLMEHNHFAHCPSRATEGGIVNCNDSA